MDRMIGIDYGRARVGVAMSDPLGIFASPLETVVSAKIIDYLQKLTTSETVVRFVVGYPMNLNGRPAEAAADVDVFLKQLAKHFPSIPVELEDERPCPQGDDRRGDEEKRQAQEGIRGQDQRSHYPPKLPRQKKRQ